MAKRKKSIEQYGHKRKERVNNPSAVLQQSVFRLHESDSTSVKEVA